MNKDYYGILGINKDATETEIKNAYRTLASKYHPDVSTDPKATEKMAAINEAYSVLKDPNKRAEYDQYGNLNETENTYNYNPNPNMYDYNSGYVFIRRRFPIFKFIFFLIVIIPILRMLLLLMNTDIYDYDLKYRSTSNSTIEVTGISTNFFSNEVEINVEIPKSKTYGLLSMKINGIGAEAFREKDYIKSITLYSSIDYIDSFAFYGCDNLETIYFYGTSEEFNSITVEKGNEAFLNAEVIYQDTK